MECEPTRMPSSSREVACRCRRTPARRCRWCSMPSTVSVVSSSGRACRPPAAGLSANTSPASSGRQQHAVRAALQHVEDDGGLLEVGADRDQLAAAPVRRGEHDLQRDLGRVGEPDHACRAARRRRRRPAAAYGSSCTSTQRRACSASTGRRSCFVVGHRRWSVTPVMRRRAQRPRGRGIRQSRVVGTTPHPGVDGGVHDGLELCPAEPFGGRSRRASCGTCRIVGWMGTAVPGSAAWTTAASRGTSDARVWAR